MFEKFWVALFSSIILNKWENICIPIIINANKQQESTQPNTATRFVYWFRAHPSWLYWWRWGRKPCIIKWYRGRKRKYRRGGTRLREYSWRRLGWLSRRRKWALRGWRTWGWCSWRRVTWRRDAWGRRSQWISLLSAEPKRILDQYTFCSMYSCSIM